VPTRVEAKKPCENTNNNPTLETFTTIFWVLASHARVTAAAASR